MSTRKCGVCGGKADYVCSYCYNSDMDTLKKQLEELREELRDLKHFIESQESRVRTPP